LRANLIPFIDFYLYSSRASGKFCPVRIIKNLGFLNVLRNLQISDI